MMTQFGEGKASSAPKTKVLSMLSLFPALLDWNWYVPFFFRIFLGFYFFNTGLLMLKKGDGSAWRTLGFLSSLVGFLFIMGLFIQVLGVIASSSSLVLLFKKKQVRFLHESSTFYVLLALVSFSLLFLGAGPYAIDLPL